MYAKCQQKKIKNFYKQIKNCGNTSLNNKTSNLNFILEIKNRKDSKVS